MTPNQKDDAGRFSPALTVTGCRASGAVIYHAKPLTAPFDGVPGGAERCLLSAQQLIISWLMMNSDLQSR